MQNQKTEPLPHTETGSKNEKIKPQNPQNALFSGFSAIPHCINFVVAMFPYACGYFPNRCLNFLLLNFSPKVTLGCLHQILSSFIYPICTLTDLPTLFALWLPSLYMEGLYVQKDFYMQQKYLQIKIEFLCGNLSR